MIYKKKAIIIVVLLCIVYMIVLCLLNAQADAKTKFYSIAEVKEQELTVPTKMYTQENVVLLAQLMEAENGSASDECMYLTGVVVLKRVKAKGFPNTVYDVIYQKGQYSTAKRLKSIKPSDRALELADELLINGVDEYPDKLVFQSMFPQGHKVYKKIDGEYFCLAK